MSSALSEAQLEVIESLEEGDLLVVRTFQTLPAEQVTILRDAMRSVTRGIDGVRVVIIPDHVYTQVDRMSLEDMFGFRKKLDQAILHKASKGES